MQQPLKIYSKEIWAIPVDVRTGKDFGNLILATVWMQDGKHYDILFNKNDELITTHEKIESLATFFEKKFIHAKLDGMECLINVVNK